MEDCLLEQHFTVAVLRNEIRRRMTATISLFIYVSQQDIILKEMVWFEIYTDLLIMSVLVTFHFEEITLFIE